MHPAVSLLNTIFRVSSIIIYLILLSGVTISSYNVTKQGDDIRSVSGCRYTYPRFMSTSSQYIKIDVISCRNMWISELPLYENVTRMELFNVPLTMLNETEMPKSIQSEKVDLRQLYWTRSHIKFVHNLAIPKLLELDLSGNIIQEVREGAFKHLALLHKLNISHNNIEKLPENLFEKPNSLRTLCLSYNRLKIVPGDIFDALFDLEILDLSNNLLNYLRENTFNSNTRLQYLNLSFNKLNTIQENTFKRLPSLQHLSLEGNILIHLEPNTFSSLSSLMVLNVGKNPLWTLPNSLLPDNNTLFILTISHTKLIKLKHSVFQNLRSLRKLYLSENHNLQNLHNDTFRHLHNIKILDLQNNNFTQLPYSIADLMPDDLLLDGNPWPCDCTIQWFVNWINSIRTLRDNIRLSSTCNSTDKDLMETLHKMQCKPTIVRISPAIYQSLDVPVVLECKTYANPQPTITWLTPNGIAYVETDTSIDPLHYHPNFENYQHLHNGVNENIFLKETGELEIKQMTREDAGEYVCLATNKIGETFSSTRLFVDPSIMQRIKIGSLICGLLWVNTFLLFSIVYLLVRKCRKCSKHTKEEKRKKRMYENMDVYKSQQLSRLKERCKNQMNRIKNNCSTQVEWMKENYKESIKNTQDHRSSYLTNQYNQQMTEIREYYLAQMHKIREHYEEEYNIILEFSVNKTRIEEIKGNSDCDAAGPTPATSNGNILSNVENGSISSTPGILMMPVEQSALEEDIYKYNDTMKGEIQQLTSLRNLHEAADITEKFGRPIAAVKPELIANRRTTGAGAQYEENPISGDFLPKVHIHNELRKPPTAASFPNIRVNGAECGQLKTCEPEDEANENTSMLQQG